MTFSKNGFIADYFNYAMLAFSTLFGWVAVGVQSTDIPPPPATEQSAPPYAGGEDDGSGAPASNDTDTGDHGLALLGGFGLPGSWSGFARNFSGLGTPCGAVGTILPTSIITASADQPRWQNYEFAVDHAGPAMLTLVNGARINAPLLHRIRSTVYLNGVRLGEQFRLSNLSHFDVDLKSGNNQLRVDTHYAFSGQQVALGIDACADAVELTPAADTPRVDEPYPVQVRVTALGKPVSGASLQLTLLDTASDDLQEAGTLTTNAAGSASTYISPTLAGPQQLVATVNGVTPLLQASNALQVASLRTFSLPRQLPALYLTEGESASSAIALQVDTVTGSGNHYELDLQASPASGVAVASNLPASGLDVTEPGEFSLLLTTTGLSAGQYQLAATVTNTDTAETSQLSIPVTVARVDDLAPISLGIPGASPTGAKPDTATNVTFRVQLDGGSPAPAALWLDKLDGSGQPLALGVAELRDDGNGADQSAGDQVYTGQYVVNGGAGELNFRARVDYAGSEQLSGNTGFLITPFPLQARASDPAQLITDNNANQYFANELQVTTLADTSAATVHTLAASINGSVVGVVPPLHLYLIQFPGDGSPQGVARAIATLQQFSAVASVSVNQPVAAAAITFNNGSCTVANGNCPNDGGNPTFWYLDRIGALSAWERAGGGDASKARVAVIDNSINCQHPDLLGQCNPANSGISNGHGTWVAGLIAASANNGTGIPGLAWNTTVRPVELALGRDQIFEDAIVNSFDLADAATRAVEPIVNISQIIRAYTAAGTPASLQPTHLQAAMCHLINQKKLVIVAAGNIRDQAQGTDIYPAHFNDGSWYCTDSQGTQRNMRDYMLAVGGSGLDSASQTDVLATWQDPTDASVVLQSNAQPFVDIYAPGTNITTLDANTRHGTSLATALVSGAAALLWADDAFVPAANQERAAAVQGRLLTSANPACFAVVGFSNCVSAKVLNIGSGVDIVVPAALRDWNSGGDLAGWQASTVASTLTYVSNGGHPQGYIHTSGNGSTMDIGADTESADFTGDLSGNRWRVSLDVRPDSGQLQSLMLRFRYLDFTQNGWVYVFPQTPPANLWTTLSVEFDPAWTDAQALANGWQPDSALSPTAQPSQSWSTTLSDVYTTEVRLSGSLQIGTGIDNFKLERLP